MHVIKVCQKCGQCCQGSLGPFIFPSDLQTLSDVLGMERVRFLDEYCVLCNIPNEAELVLYSLRMPNGKCIFLNASNLCSIYENRPYQCKNAPFRFLAEYQFWQHMKCIQKTDFEGLDSSESDKKIFEELKTIGYK